MAAVSWDPLSAWQWRHGRMSAARWHRVISVFSNWKQQILRCFYQFTELKTELTKTLIPNKTTLFQIQNYVIVRRYNSSVLLIIIRHLSVVSYTIEHPGRNKWLSHFRQMTRNVTRSNVHNNDNRYQHNWCANKVLTNSSLLCNFYHNYIFVYIDSRQSSRDFRY